MIGFIKLMRSQETAELIKDPKALALMSLVALRARWNDAPNRYNLKVGQALVGDHKECGLSQKEYRTAKNRLQKMGFVAFKGTNKGTIATILTPVVFEISPLLDGEQRGDQGANKRPHKRQAEGDQWTTNEEDKTISSREDEIKIISYSDTFLEWWEAYPLKVGKKKAYRAYGEALKLVSHHTLLDSVSLMIKEVQHLNRDAECYPHPERWLRDQRWDDEY